MNQLWTPWRKQYILQEKPLKSGCPFCQKLQDDESHDRANLLLYRGANAFVVLNLYPYNNGHLLVLPYAHTPSLEELDSTTRSEVMELAVHFTGLLRMAYNPQGFNIGANIGPAAGAGIAEHFHLHIVPRWSGDTNFMPVIGQTKTLSETLEQTYDHLFELLKSHLPVDSH